MNIKYGIMVVDSREDDDGLNAIVHFCGYENSPTQHGFDSLKEELSTDESFGLVNEMQYLVLAEAPSEIIA